MHMVEVKGVGRVPLFPKTYPFVTIKGYFFYHILKGYFRNTYTATYMFLQGFPYIVEKGQDALGG